MKASNRQSNQFHLSTPGSPQTRQCTNQDSYDRLEIERSIRYVKHRLKNLLSSLEDGSSTINYGNRIIRCCPADVLRAFAAVDFNSTIDVAIRNIFLDSIQTCEHYYPGSGYICALMICDIISANDTVLPERYRAIEEDVIDTLKVYLTKNSLCYNLALESFYAGGFESKLFYKKSRNNDAHIKSYPGKVISAKIPPNFKFSIKKLEKPRVMFIDGILESVSEVDSLLRDAADKGCTVCLLARGFAPDLIQTLSHNFNNGHLSVIPVVYRANQDDEVVNFCQSIKVRCFEPKVNNDIRSATVESADAVESVFFSTDNICISVEEGDIHNVEICLPPRLSPLWGIMKDRIDTGKFLIEAGAKRGIVEISEINKKFSFLNYQHAKTAYKSLQKNIDNLHKMIIC